MRLFRTTRKGKSGHFHYVYFDETDPTGQSIVVTETKNHTHPAISQQPAEVPFLDPAFILIGEEDDHSHEISDTEILWSDSVQPVIDPGEPHTIVGDNTRLYEAAFKREEKSKERGDIAENMYIGRQWIDDYGNEIEMSSDLKAKLTVNLIQPYLKLVLGFFRQNRTDFKFVPVEDSDALIADVLTAIAKIESSNSDYEFEENQVVEDQNITGRGNFICYIDYDKNVLGDIRMERVPWRQVVYGEHNKMSAADAGFVAMAQYMTKEEMDAEWGDEVENLIPTLNALEKEFERRLKEDHTGTLDAYDKETKAFRIIQMWKREWTKVYSIINEDFVSTSDKKFPDMDQLEQLGFRQIDRKIEYVRKQVVTGFSIVLDDEITEVDMLPITPVYYDKRADIFWGKVDLAIDLQRFLNKTFSKVADYVNKFVTSTHFYDEDTFPDSDSTRTEQDIAQNLEQPGTFMKVGNIKNVPQPMINGVLPPGVFTLLNDIKELILTVFNLNPAFIGMPASADSGIKVMQNKQQSIMGQESAFDNLNLSKKRVGKLLVKNIATVYTPDRVMRVMASNAVQGMEFNFNGQPEVVEEAFTPEQLNEIATRFETADLLKYDVATTQSPYSPSTMIANYMMMTESMNAGHFPVPPEAMVELNPFIDVQTKKKVSRMLAAAREQQIAQQQADNQAQNERTAIAGRLDIAKEIVKQSGQEAPQ